MKHRPIVWIALFYMGFLMITLRVIPRWGEALFGYARQEEKAELFMAENKVFRGQICKLEKRENGYRARLRLIEGLDCQLLLDEAACQPGDWVEVEGNAWTPEAATNPGQWNAKEYARRQRLAFYVKAETMRVVKEEPGSLYALRGRLLELLKKQMESIWPEPYSAFMQSMLLGDKSELDAELQDLFREGGIAHVMAISGLHLSVMGEVLLAILGKIQRPKWAKIETTIGLWLYVWLTGAAVTTLRAAIMMSMKMIAAIVGREEDFVTSLALAAFLLLLYQPLYLFDAGFGLSFAAMLGMQYGKLWILMLPGIGRRWKKAVAAPLGITLATLPLSLWYFFQTSVWGFILNFWVVPAMTLVLIGGLAATLLSFLHPMLGKGAALLVIVLLQSFQWGSEWIIRLPGAMLRGKPELYQLIAYYALLAFPQWYYAKHRAGWKGSGIAVVLVLVMQWKTTFWRVTYLDVGQGDAAVVEWKNQVWLIDAGLAYDTVIKPYLMSRGIWKIDMAVVSHPDLDHMEGMLKLSEDPDFTVRQLVVADALSQDIETRQKLEQNVQQQGGHLQRVRAGKAWQQTDILASVLAPTQPLADMQVSAGKNAESTPENDSSLVLLLELQGHSFLFTGDISSSAEALLSWPQADIVKIAHHGSRFSSSEDFLRQVQPKCGIISCGRENRYGHPHEETLTRLKEADISYISTAQRGAITITERRGRVTIEPFCDEE